jgi:hypothetical protein
MAESETAKLTVVVPRELWRRARVRAAETDVDLRTVVIRALEAFLASRPKKGGERS